MRHLAIRAACVLATLWLVACGRPAPETLHEARATSDAREEKAERQEARRAEKREGEASGEFRASERNERGSRDRQRSPDFPASRVPGDSRNSDLRASGGYDLERDEQLGGHTLRKHVGRSDAELRDRLEEEPQIAAASTWTSGILAEETLAAALRAAEARIARWQARGERRANLPLHYDAGREIGRSLERGARQTVPCTAAVIVLKASGDGFYVLTSYPEAAR
jgi:hypothetical protein